MGRSSGTKLGPYEILSPLGAGGMGEVYRARGIVDDGRLMAVADLAQELTNEGRFTASGIADQKDVLALMAAGNAHRP